METLVLLNTTRETNLTGNDGAKGLLPDCGEVGSFIQVHPRKRQKRRGVTKGTRGTHSPCRDLVPWYNIIQLDGPTGSRNLCL